MEARLTRRRAGALQARLPEARLEAIADPRDPRGLRWPLPALVKTILIALVSGRKSLAEAESLTEEMSPTLRRRFGIRRRVPDTTLRDIAIQLAPSEVSRGLHGLTRAAHRRKALSPEGLPFGVVAIDGKYVTVDDWDDARTERDDWDSWNEHYAQLQSGNEGTSSERLGSLTCSLVSSRGGPCIEAIPIPAATNEMGHFPVALAKLHQVYETLDLFSVVSADSGMCSESHGRLVVEEYRWDYLFGLKDNQPTLRNEAERLMAGLRPEMAEAESVDVVGKHTVTRRLYRTEELAGYLDWDHLHTVLRVESVTEEIASGKVTAYENRYFLCSLRSDQLTAKQWLRLVRCHWGVENNCHHTWDTAFEEDDRPWIVANPKGTMVIMLLRRIAYNIVTLYRSVTQRSDERRATPWKTLLRWFYNMLIAAQPSHLEGLRPRRATATAGA